MNLTQLIFEYWKSWMTAPDDIIQISLRINIEGLYDCGDNLMTFWYALNHEWHKMNDKKYSFTGCDEEYKTPFGLH